MTAPTPLTKEELARYMNDTYITNVYPNVPRLLATLAAETKRADQAYADKMSALARERALTGACNTANRSRAEWFDKATEAERQRDDLAARVVVLVDAVVDACASECKLRDEAKRIMSPDLERYAEAAHSLANLKARILAMTDGIAAAVALRERLEKAEKDAAVNIRLRKSLGPALEAKTQECVILQRRITALEATARTPGTVEVCKKCRASFGNWIWSEWGKTTMVKNCDIEDCPLRPARSINR